LEMMSKFNPSDFNQGMMELGALVCKPRNPHCNTCPLSPNCKAFSINKQEQFPIKKEKPVRKIRFFHYFICLNNKSEFLLTQRKKDDVWKELYEFPMIETVENSVPNTELIKDILGMGLNIKNFPPPIAKKKHILTHREIHAIFYIVICNNMGNSSFVCVGTEERAQFPVHSLMQFGFSALDNWMKSSRLSEF
jgi:A/G-specific adenine glycosylase